MINLKEIYMAYTKNKEIVSRIVHKHDTEANWLKATSFIPLLGEIIVYDIDTTHEHERFKIGDGKTLVNDLPFQVDISDFEDYKVKQSKVVDPSASGEALAFIDTIMQDEMGVITVTKKNVGKVSTAGTADKLASLTVTLTGDVTGTQTIQNGNSVSIATDLSETGVTAGAYGTDGKTLTYGDTFTVPNFSVDTEGRLTAAANKTFTLPQAIQDTNTTYTLSADNATENEGIEIKLDASEGSDTSVRLVGTGTTNLVLQADKSIAINTADHYTGTVKSITAGTDLTGGTITESGTIAHAPVTRTDGTNN
jgi:hypothetical protein